MTHFTVLVALNGNDEEKSTWDEIHDVILPYKEYGCGAADDGLEPYLEFEVKVPETQFKEKAKEIIMKAESSSFKNYPDLAPGYKKLFKEGKYTEIFEDWYGGTEYNGDWGYWYNPNYKWDWFSIGGRWNGIMVDKDGEEVDEVRASHLDLKATDKNYNGEFDTWAFVSEGEWYEKSKMGWWCTHGEVDGDYHEKFREFLNDAIDKDLRLVLIDCHI